MLASFPQVYMLIPHQSINMSSTQMQKEKESDYVCANMPKWCTVLLVCMLHVLGHANLD